MHPLITYDNGIAIEGLGFRLDATRSCDCSFVSHAHHDHARKHERIVATAETALMYRHRFPDVPARVLPYGRKVKFADAVVELIPSGHMLGAAQIMVEVKKTRVLYTGDFKVFPNLTCPSLETHRCDVLIMESTYGDPIYSFPPQNGVYTRIISFVKRALSDKYIPVLVGYAIGKAQEVIFLLQSHGFEVAVDAAISKINQLYRIAGVKLASTAHYLHSSLEGRVVVVSPQTLRHEEFRALKRKRSLFLSGWSAAGGGRGSFATDAGIPLSDHADFGQLLRFVEACAPRKIYTMHGEPKFAHLLRENGYDAEYLTKGFRSDQSHERPLSARRKKAVIGENYELF